MQEKLRQIDALIKGEHWDKARRELRRLLKQDPHNAGGWWLYAKVAPDLDEACIALRNVLALNPDNAPAQAALDILERRKAEPSTPSSDDAEVIEADIKDPTAADFKTSATRSSQDQIETFIGVLLLMTALVVGVGVLFYVVSPGLAGGGISRRPGRCRRRRCAR